MKKNSMVFNHRAGARVRHAGEQTFLLLIGAILVIVLLAAGCTTGPSAPSQGSRTGTGPGGNDQVQLPPADPAPLSAAEAGDLLYLREEEQLAHDLYARWAVNYTVPVFGNIAQSETNHLGQVQQLIDRYGVPGRIGNGTYGYTQPAIQSLYDTLGPKGDASLAGAYEGGLAVEETDIADIDRMKANTTRADLLQVYANLRQGSENHRSAFLRMSGR